MPITDEIIRQARRANRGAVEAILADCYPALHRMAHALAGEPRSAQRVVRIVLRRAVRVMPRWRKGITPENWFYHHALLVSRETAPATPSLEQDLLVTAGPAAQPAYAAFVRAIRALPRQQMEAFILNHGEKLNSRLLGVAMDCSAGAAATHLEAATAALKRIAVETYFALTANLERAYAALSPPPTIIHAAVGQEAGAVLLSLRLRRLFRWTFIAGLIALAGWAGWRWQGILLQWFDAIRSHVSTRPS